MKLQREFYKLPVQFDVARLFEEVSQFAESDWREHPQKYNGNTSIPLITVNGGINDEIDGPMAMTGMLARCPYIRQVLAAFRTVFGRSRLMRLEPGAEVPEHTDVHYYWRNRVRIHIPIVTDPTVQFFVKDKSVHMAPGEAWIFDSWKPHRVINPASHHRVHLVADTVGTAAFWELVQQLHLAGTRTPEPVFIPWQPEVDPALRLERFNQAAVMPAAELNASLREMIEDVRSNSKLDPHLCGDMVQALDKLRHDWQSTWVEHGATPAGWPVYTQLLEIARTRLAKLPRSLTLSSTGYPAIDAIEAVLKASLNQKLAAPLPATPQPAAVRKPRFDRPVFILAAPRSGSTLLYETLAGNRGFWTVGDESHRQFESIPALHPATNGYTSNRVDATQATDDVRTYLLANLAEDLRDTDGVRWQDLPPQQQPEAIRLLEKTPKNALRVPFLRALFPDARFIYLYRNPRDNLSSLLDAWRSGRFRTYPQLPGWQGEPWSHLLVPGWQQLVGKPLAEIVSNQWQVTHQIVLDDLSSLPDDQWCMVDYADLLTDTPATVEALCQFCAVPFGQRMQQLANGPLKNSRYTLSQPDPDKWRRNAAELETVLPQVEALDGRLRDLLQQRGLFVTQA